MHKEIFDKQGNPIIRIEYFHDYGVDAEGNLCPDAFPRFRSRLSKLHETYGNYASYVIESVTSMALSSRKHHQLVLNPNSREPRQWHAGATDDLEEFLCMRFPALPYNVGVSLHASREKDEVSECFVRNLAAPGRLANRHQLAAYWPEVYRAYAREMVVESISKTPDVYHFMQTKLGRIEGEQWFAASQIKPPPAQPCWNDYRSLWGEEDRETFPTLHALVYGDTGAGKSTFLASFPKPMYVFFFDGLGKDGPYLQYGEDGGLQDDR